MQEQQQIQFFNNEEESSNLRLSTSSTSTVISNEAIGTEQRKKRSRTTFSSEQLLAFERYFKENRYVNRPRRIELANALNLSEKKVKVWFQNRRMKDKKELQIRSRSAKSPSTDCEKTPSYTSDTVHQTLHNTTQSPMWVMPNAIPVSNINLINTSQNNNCLTTLNFENINHLQQEREQNYFQPAVESVVSAQQIQMHSSYNVLQNDMYSPYNQYVSYQTNYSDTTCSQLQQEMYNYQQQWNNCPTAQNNVNYFSKNTYVNTSDDCAYNNVAQTQNNYTYNNSAVNSSFNVNISAAPQESIDTPYNFENDPFLESALINGFLSEN